MSKLLTDIILTPLSTTFRAVGVELPFSVNEPLLSNSKELDGSSSEKAEIRIQGMTCGACVESIEGMLKPQKGIHSVVVALLAERGVVEFDPTVWNPEKICEEISDIGFDATIIPPAKEDSVILRIYGLQSPTDVSAVETSLANLPGVNSTSISDSLCEIDFDRNFTSPRQLVDYISSLGYDSIIDASANGTQIESLHRTKEIMEWRARLTRSLTLAIPVFFLGMVFPHVPVIQDVVNWQILNGLYLGDLLILILTTPAQFWIGAKFYENAFKALRHKSATMDVLVMIGTSAAYFYSAFAMLFALFNTEPGFRPALFFDTSTMLIMFVSLGRYLENKAKGRTSAALTDLMSLAPSMATIYTDAPACTQEKKIATELVEVGDVVKLVPGDKIPADGTVLRGSSTVDESAITGEAVPVLKQVGDQLIGGTVNGLGTFDMTVTRAGKDTALSQIVKLVEEAQTSKAPIQAFADKVAGYFVPTVITLGALTFLVWILISSIMADEKLPEMFRAHGSSKLAICLQMCISVIVVACPCALGLSTPTAIMVGTGMGAKNGILIKGGRPLENARHIRRVVLDKTGTVTIGKLSVVGLCWAPSPNAANEELYGGDSNLEGVCGDGTTLRTAIIAMVNVTEARSEHPLAKAIALYGKDLLRDHQIATGDSTPEPEVITFESVTGAGVKAIVKHGGNKHELLVGSSRFVSEDSSTGIPRSLKRFEHQETSQGRTIIYVGLKAASSSKTLPILSVSLADEPKPSSKYAIRALHKMGIEVNMMTGDGKATAIAIAKQVGIHPDGVWASVSPQGKATLITELMEKHKHGVAMVGDGINDSPALVAATVGVALSSGTSVAIEAADIVLMKSDLLDVVAALHLSKSIFAVIQRNLIWACIYNVLGIPLAMGVFLPFGIYMHPMLAGAAMAFSSVSVVTSSLTLKWWRRPADSVMPTHESLMQHSGVGWTGMFLDSTRTAVSDVWDSFRGAMTGRTPRVEGYSAVPLEMSTRSDTLQP